MIRERRVNKPIVAIEKGMSEAKALEKALDMLPINEIIKPGDKVVIAPNWVKDYKPSSGTVVGPNTLRKLIRYIKEKNPKSITIAVGAGGAKTPDVMKKVGYDKILEEENIEFVDMNYGPYIDLDINHNIIKSTPINKIVNEADVIISFTQLKMHEEATITASIKNIAMGWPPAEIHGYPKKKTGIHEDLHGFISCIMNKIPIDISIVSCDKAMIGTGPTGGIPIDTNGLIIVGTDPVAVDTIGARLLGFLPQAIAYLYKLYNDGIGEAKVENMIIKGIELKKAEKLFTKAAYGKSVILDNNEIKNIHGSQPK
ncbi:DUF362 domain-containing protein [Paeniclostridium hominis]|uniref:DUF362 domain-containing protein n=1 Tax=Paeniclostridium hominis TaxID=2764329 RepID=UPI0022E837C6|nr:DUF362 domain-containing protein [Paeniclostridium hominis]